MIARAFLILIACAALVGAAHAQPFDVTAEVSQAGELARQGKINKSLRLLKKAVRRQTVPKAKAALLTARGNILLVGKNNRKKAWEAFDAAQALMPGEPMVAQVMFNMGRRSDLELAVRGLETLIASYPDVTRDLDVFQVQNVVNGLYATGKPPEARALSAKLGRIGFGGDEIELRDSFTMAALDEDVARGDLDAAKFLAASIDDRGTLIALLTDRRYESLWPAVEARIGARMEQPTNAAILTGERLLREKPDDTRARLVLVTALVDADRLKEAEVLAAEFARTPEAMTTIDEPGGWLVNKHASILRSLDRTDEADARFAQLTRLDIAKRPWIISMVINRFTRLVVLGKTKEAAPLIAQAKPWADQYGSPYARQLVRIYGACVAAIDKQAADLEAQLPEMVANANDAPVATAEGLLCAGRAEDAARAVIALFNHDQWRGSVIASMQRPARSADGWTWPGDLTSLLSRPDVRGAFDRAGRMLPERLRHAPGA